MCTRTQLEFTLSTYSRRKVDRGKRSQVHGDNTLNPPQFDPSFLNSRAGGAIFSTCAVHPNQTLVHDLTVRTNRAPRTCVVRIIHRDFDWPVEHQEHKKKLCAYLNLRLQGIEVNQVVLKVIFPSMILASSNF